MKTWTEDNPKADLMLRKRTAIVEAARHSFLEGGYAQTSMDRIAEAAGVSVKTVYRHFQNKDDLFSAVMQAACSNAPEAFAAQSSGPPADAHPWFDQAPRIALPLAGAGYLRHILSEEQLALYRVVTRDAHSFPELARRYHDEAVGKRNQVFAQYLIRWRRPEKWKLKDPEGASNAFAALLCAGIFEGALHGIHVPTEKELTAHARMASACLLNLLGAGCL
ncbi:MAG TPA: TetR/AcrR family transcriptional regulator [Acidobacteriaceae bacterium]